MVTAMVTVMATVVAITATKKNLKQRPEKRISNGSDRNKIKRSAGASAKSV